MAAVVVHPPKVHSGSKKQNLRFPQLDVELRQLQTEPATDTED